MEEQNDHSNVARRSARGRQGEQEGHSGAQPAHRRPVHRARAHRPRHLRLLPGHPDVHHVPDQRPHQFQRTPTRQIHWLPELHHAVPEPGLLDRRQEHPRLRGAVRPDRRDHRARVRTAAQPQGPQVRRLLPHLHVPAVRHLADRRRDRMAVHPLPVPRSHPVLGLAARRSVAPRPAWYTRNVDGHHRLHHRVEELRLLHGHLPRRPAGHLRRTVRSRLARRRQRMAEVPLHHAAGPPPDLQLRGHLRPHRLLPGLRSGLHPDLRRPGPLH